MNNDVFWLVTLLILCVGFSIQPLKALWRKLRPSSKTPPNNETPPKNRTMLVPPAKQPTSEPLPEQRRSILKRYNIPSSYLGYLSHLDNEELEEWARTFHSANEDRRWQ